MKINLESAKAMAAMGFLLVKDSKSTIVHSLNKDTGESGISYKTQYLLQKDDNPYDQRKISIAVAKSIAKDSGLHIDNVPECFQWSSLQK